jgi:glycosyltransferase involved in cell wall biosynthesis
MKITVIVPFYNSGKTIYRCIKSVLDQTYKNFEILCVNDGSVDNSVNTIKKFRDPRIKIIQKMHNGMPASNINDAAKVAIGKYLSFLDSDDYWEQNKLQNQINFFKNSNYIAVSSNGYFVRKNKLYPYIKKKIGKISLSSFYFDNYVLFQSLILEKKLFLKVGGFSESVNIRSFYDLDLCLKICLYKQDIGFVNKKLVYYLDNPSISNRRHSPSNLKKFLFIANSLIIWAIKKKLLFRTIYFLIMFLTFRSFIQLKKFLNI